MELNYILVLGCNYLCVKCKYITNFDIIANCNERSRNWHILHVTVTSRCAVTVL